MEWLSLVDWKLHGEYEVIAIYLFIRGFAIFFDARGTE